MKSTHAERDLIAALARLRDGRPTNPELIARASQGKLKITPVSVAKEAGRSRTSIAMENCRYPDVRRMVLESKDQSPLQIKRSQALKDMGTQVRRLELAIKVKDSALAVAMSRIAQLEQRLQEYEPVDPKVPSIRRRKSAHEPRKPK